MVQRVTLEWFGLDTADLTAIWKAAVYATSIAEGIFLAAVNTIFEAVVLSVG